MRSIELCWLGWGDTNDCPESAHGHLCIRLNGHEGKCRCCCKATTEADPIFYDPEELEIAREHIEDLESKCE